MVNIEPCKSLTLKMLLSHLCSAINSAYLWLHPVHKVGTCCVNPLTTPWYLPEITSFASLISAFIAANALKDGYDAIFYFSIDVVVFCRM